MKLVDAEKISNYVKREINPYGKPFEGTAYEFGLKLMKYLENASADYDINKVVEKLYDYDTCLAICANRRDCYSCKDLVIDRDDAVEIVKRNGIYE